MNRPFFSKTRKLQRISEIEKRLSTIQDIDILLEQVLTEMRSITNADAGSIYVVDGAYLKIKYAQNDTQQRRLAPGEKLPYLAFSFPIDETSIAGYVAHFRRPLNIADAYAIDASCPFHFDQTIDESTGYQTRSIYTVPLAMANGTILGVVQIINARTATGTVTAFDRAAEIYITHFSKNVEQALQNAYRNQSMVRRMLRMMEFRDPKETYRHVERVSLFSIEIYDRYAFNARIAPSEAEKFREVLIVAAKFHDIGKIGISDTILKKPARLTDEERAVMQQHTFIGASLFMPAESPLDEMASAVALYHHDWFDGTDVGYTAVRRVAAASVWEGDTSCKVGTDIPLAARIVAVADVFDALSHSRCYKAAWDVDSAFAEIARLRGTQFDPAVVDAFMAVKDRICAIQHAYPDRAADEPSA
ncbi:MAG: HD domain-containing protein [Treponema sp.]|nr:HD domain-containing protein [Treponema sp.]